ncbi:hypothetical protein ACFSTE_21545 [Aquimarina hainanensis]|uniref:Uncharacterized protein n=1 Tax=Aquimarina hainanensis TaxID=1578017 RepID=A0ABW5NE95_9FLAO
MSTTQIFLIHLFELIAAVLGTIYLKKKYRDDNKSSRYLVLFLWLTVLVEKVGLIPRLSVSFDELAFFKDTFLGKSNYWIYNPYNIISFLFYIYYMKMNVVSNKNKNILKVLSIFYLLITSVNLIFVEGFFAKSLSGLTFILGSLLIMYAVGLYFYEVLQSDIILNFKKMLPFYVAIGVLVFNLVVTPLFIYSKFYAHNNPDFIKVYTSVLIILNVFLYSCYSLGFILCWQKNKSY